MDYWWAKGYAGPPLKLLSGGGGGLAPLHPSLFLRICTCTTKPFQNEEIGAGGGEGGRELIKVELMLSLKMYS